MVGGLVGAEFPLQHRRGERLVERQLQPDPDRGGGARGLGPCPQHHRAGPGVARGHALRGARAAGSAAAAPEQG